jgi:hypothetical protein
MTFAERLQRWNHWYDGLPEEWRFQAILWPLILLGAINMGLTVSVGFPFGLLVVIALIGLVVVRVPYNLGWVEPVTPATTGEPASPKISISAVPWVWDINLWYDGLPETRRPWVILVVLAVAGGINMVLTINHAFPFGILFLLALLAIILVRAPYVAGWLIPPQPLRPRIAAAAPPEQIAQEVPAPVAPLHLAAAEPAPVELAPEPPPPAMHEPPMMLPPDDKPA